MVYQIENVTKVFRARGFGRRSAANSRRDTLALRDVSLDIHAGEFLSVLGPSGEGKSTLLYMLGGLDTPTQGTVHFEGRPLHRRNLVAFRRNQVGFIFQMFHLLPYKSALDNVALGLTVSGASKGKARHEAKQWLKRLGLSDRVHHHPGALSGGESQRVAIARAMVKQPKVLLADEPTGNLDKDSRVDVLKEIKRLNKEHGVTVVMVTHNEQDARQYSTRVAVIDSRTIARVGDPDDLLAR